MACKGEGKRSPVSLKYRVEIPAKFKNVDSQKQARALEFATWTVRQRAKQPEAEEEFLSIG